MRKIIYILILGAILVTCYQLVSNKYNTIQQRKSDIGNIPNISLLTVDSVLFNLSDKKSKEHSTTIIIFSVDCIFCIDEMIEIESNIGSATCTDFIFISSDSLSQIKAIANESKLSNHVNITFAQASRTVVQNQFQTTSIPHVLLYNRSGKLVKEFKGKPPINTLLNQISKAC